MTDTLTWPSFVKMYADTHQLTYSQSIKEAGPAWVEYKEKHGVKPRKRGPNAVTRTGVVKAEGSKTAAPKKKVSAGEATAPVKRGKQTVSVPKAPPGKRLVYYYEEEAVEVKPKPKAKKPIPLDPVGEESEEEHGEEEDYEEED